MGITIPKIFTGKIYAFLNSEISISDFEQWVYAQADELGNELNKDVFLELISFSYQLSGAKYDLSKLLRTLIDEADYEKYRILKLLNDTLVYSPNSQQNIAQFYDLYCEGYGFFDDLAFPYGLNAEAPLQNEEDTEAMIKSYYPKITTEIKKVIHWIENKEVILKPISEEDFPKYDYEDNRQRYVPQKQNYRHIPKEMRPKQKKWWQFWK
jgi:hypothetical protein